MIILSQTKDIEKKIHMWDLNWETCREKKMFAT